MKKKMVLSFISNQIERFRSIFKSKQETRLTCFVAFHHFHQKPKKKEGFLESSGNSESEKLKRKQRVDKLIH